VGNKKLPCIRCGIRWKNDGAFCRRCFREVAAGEGVTLTQQEIDRMAVERAAAKIQKLERRVPKPPMWRELVVRGRQYWVVWDGT
jgi:hypothetical protein